jgi:hypothetical protein
VTVGSGIDLSGTTTRTSQESPHNASRFSITGSAADTIEYKYASTEDFTGSQMVAFCEYRTSRASTFFRVYSGGVLQGERLLETDDIWRYVSIPFSGGANPEFTISGDSATTEEISIDNCFIGKQNPNAVQKIADAHFVGSLTYIESLCIWEATTNGDFPVDADCNASNIIGGVSAPDTKIPGIKIINPRTDGYYDVRWQGLTYHLSGSSSCNFTLGATSSYSQGRGAVYSDGAAKTANQIYNTFRFNDSADKTVRITVAPGGATSCRAYGIDAKFTVHFYPDESVTAVEGESLSPDKAGFLIWSVFDGNIEGHLKADGSCVKASDYPDYAKNVGSTYGVCTVDTRCYLWE